MNIVVLIVAFFCAAWIVALPFLLYFTVRDMVILERELKKMRGRP